MSVKTLVELGEEANRLREVFNREYEELSEGEKLAHLFETVRNEEYRMLGHAEAQTDTDYDVIKHFVWFMSWRLEFLRDFRRGCRNG